MQKVFGYIAVFIVGLLGFASYRAFQPEHDGSFSTAETVHAQARVEKLVYSSTASGNKEIYTMNPDGTNIIRLTNNSAGDEGAVWSPDGSKIAFKSNRDGDYEIYVMNSDGSNVVKLTDNPAHDRAPSWSPDGTRISFSSDRDGDYEVYIMNADGSNVQRVTNNSHLDRTSAWSPDGTKIAYTSLRGGNFEIFVSNLNGTGETNLSNNPAADQIPAWKPDGSKLAFRSDRNGGDADLFVMNPDGSGQTAITNNTTDDLGPAWSPDGTKIAFSAMRDGNSEIYIINADGSNPTRITQTAAAEDDIDWGLASDVTDATPTPTPISVTPTPTPPGSTITPPVASGDFMPPSGYPKYIPKSQCTHFVSKQGSDSNPGTESQPFASIQKGIGAMSAGKTLCIKGYTDGSFYTDPAATTNNGAIGDIQNKNGTSGNPITIGGYEPDKRVILRGVGQNAKEAKAFRIRNSSHIRLVGMEFTELWNGMETSLIRDLDLINLKVYKNESAGINITRSAGDNYRVRIEHSEIYDNVRKATRGAIGGGAIQMLGVKEGAYRYNKLYRNFGEGLNIGRGSDRVIIEDNLFSENDHGAFYINNSRNILYTRNLTICTGERDKWQAENGRAGQTAHGTAIILRNEDGQAFAGYSNTGNNAVINNVVMGCTTHLVLEKQDSKDIYSTLISHNTFIDPRRSLDGSDPKPARFMNTNTTAAPFVEPIYIQNNLYIVVDPSAEFNRIDNLHTFPNVHFLNNITNKDLGFSEGMTVVHNLPFQAAYDHTTFLGSNKKPWELTDTELGYIKARFMLAPDSPAIDAGTPDVSGGFKQLYEFFSRIDYFFMGRTEKPDVGAHEFDGTVVVVPTPTPSENSCKVTTSYDCDVTVNPGQSIQNAINNATNGQTICLKGGTYQEQIDFRNKSGITVANSPGETPVLDGGFSPTLLEGEWRNVVRVYDSVCQRGVWAGMMNVFDSSDIVVDGLTMKNSCGRGILIGDNSHNVTVQNSYIDWTEKAGVYISDQTSNTRILGNIFTRNSFGDVYNMYKYRDYAVNITAAMSGQDTVFQGNIIAWGRGEIAMSGSRNLLFEGNVIVGNKNNFYPAWSENITVRNNLFYAPDEEATAGTHWEKWWEDEHQWRMSSRNEIGGVGRWGLPGIVGISYYNNVIVNMRVGFDGYHRPGSQIISSDTTGVYFGHNTVISGTETDRIFNIAFMASGGEDSRMTGIFENNVFDTSKNRSAIIPVRFSGNDDVTFRNNIWPTDAPTEVRGSGDIYTNDPGVTNPLALVTFAPPPIGAETIDVSGLLTAVNLQNYLLRQGSPAINHGSTGTSVSGVVIPPLARSEDFSKFARSGVPDIGAFELGSSGALPLLQCLPPGGGTLQWHYWLQDLVRIFEADDLETTTRSWAGQPPIPGPLPAGLAQAIFCDASGQASVTPEAGNERLYTALGCIPISTSQAFTIYVLQWALGIGGGITILFIIYASYKIMTSSGDPQKLQAGKDMFTAAASGLVFIIFSVFILRVIGSEILRIPGL